MKKLKTILSVMLLGLAAVSCNDNFDTPPMVAPVAQDKPNTTIAEFKAKYWQDAPNYIDTVKEDLVIHGRVVSSDASGNIYKSLYIQDETGALTISINANSLYNTYRVGQEIVIPLKDMYVGKYNGQQQLGYPAYYESGNVWEATFMSLELFKAHAQLNGMPDPSDIDTVACSIADLKHDAESLRKWQGRLVRFDGVKFQDADGDKTFAEDGSTTNRNIVDENGNSLVLRNSNYATFRTSILPTGQGSVVGVLSYYNTRAGSNGTWQLYIRDTKDCIGFSTNTKGTSKNPYTIDEVVANQGTANGWLTGYVVGAVAPEVTKVRSNADIQWTAPTTLDNTLIIGPSADCRDYTKCVAVSLPQNTPFRTQANLKDNAEVLGTQIWLNGKFANYMGMAGVTGNSGSADEFRLSIVTGGVTSLNETFEGGAIPAGWQNVKVKGNKEFFIASYGGNSYAKVSGYNGAAPFDTWLISPAINIKKAAKRMLSFRTEVNSYGSTETTFEVYVMSTADPNTAKMQKLSPALATAPASGFSDWVESGNLDLSAWADGTYYIGFRYASPKADNYATWQLDDVKFGDGSGSVIPPTPASGTRADLETMNSGEPTGFYNTYTSKAGWKVSNGNLLKGGDVDSNPVFKFIGYMTGSTKDYAFAPCLNGKTSSVGTLTSPELTSGISTLSFNYGMPYTDKALKFRVDVLQAGAVVKSFTVEQASPVKYTVYTFSEAIDVAGNYSIEFTNLSPSNTNEANRDRVAIWNITWTQPSTKVVRDPRSRVR